MKDKGMIFHGDGCKKLLVMLLQLFKQNGGKNLVTIEFCDKDGEKYVATVKRVKGKSEAQILREMKKQLADCEKDTAKVILQRLMDWRKRETTLQEDIYELARLFGVEEL